MITHYFQENDEPDFQAHDSVRSGRSAPRARGGLRRRPGSEERHVGGGRNFASATDSAACRIHRRRRRCSPLHTSCRCRDHRDRRGKTHRHLGFQRIHSGADRPRRTRRICRIHDRQHTGRAHDRPLARHASARPIRRRPAPDHRSRRTLGTGVDDRPVGVDALVSPTPARIHRTARAARSRRTVPDRRRRHAGVGHPQKLWCRRCSADHPGSSIPRRRQLRRIGSDRHRPARRHDSHQRHLRRLPRRHHRGRPVTHSERLFRPSLQPGVPRRPHLRSDCHRRRTARITYCDQADSAQPRRTSRDRGSRRPRCDDHTGVVPDRGRRWREFLRRRELRHERPLRHPRTAGRCQPRVTVDSPGAVGRTAESGSVGRQAFPEPSICSGT